MRLCTAANPPGIIEFFFDTARTIMDLTLSQTIHNFTKLRYAIAHEGGAFPSIEDRFLKQSPTLEASSKGIYNTRYVCAVPSVFTERIRLRN